MADLTENNLELITGYVIQLAPVGGTERERQAYRNGAADLAAEIADRLMDANFSDKLSAMRLLGQRTY